MNCFWIVDGGPHVWMVASEHRTSQGVLQYLKCDCGRHDVQLRGELIATC